MKRRDFLRNAVLCVSAWQLMPVLKAAAGSQPPGKKILVTIQLSGGNDGLNMVVPYTNPAYAGLRPQLAHSQSSVLPLAADAAFAPAMTALHGLYKQGKVAVVQSCGYPNPNRSHFRSIEIWQTAEPNRLGDTGWYGRYLDHVASSNELFPALNLDSGMPKTFCGKKISAPTVSNINDFAYKTDPRYAADRKDQIQTLKSIYGRFDSARPHSGVIKDAGLDALSGSDELQSLVRKYTGQVRYPNGPFGNQLRFAAQLITGGLASSAYNISLDGFDTHTNQSRQQDRLLKDLSDGVQAFLQDLKASGKDRDVLIVVFSEFGRRVAENSGRGTDHGTAGPVLVIGEAVKGGLVGTCPSLTDLDAGDLKYKIDFRSVYATILDGWLKADSKLILGQKFDNLGFV